MVGILLKIGKQSENVGEEEVFGRFCICDVTENPSGGLLRKASSGPFFRLYPAACVTDQKRFDRLSF